MLPPSIWHGVQGALIVRLPHVDHLHAPRALELRPNAKFLPLPVLNLERAETTLQDYGFSIRCNTTIPMRLRHVPLRCAKPGASKSVVTAAALPPGVTRSAAMRGRAAPLRDLAAYPFFFQALPSWLPPP